MLPDGRSRRSRAPVAGEIYVEFLKQGNTVRATAIDAETGAEAFVSGPANAFPGDLQKLAVARLLRLLGRAGESPDDPDENKTPPGQGRGIVV